MAFAPPRRLVQHLHAVLRLTHCRQSANAHNVRPDRSSLPCVMVPPAATAGQRGNDSSAALTELRQLVDGAEVREAVVGGAACLGHATADRLPAPLVVGGVSRGLLRATAHNIVRRMLELSAGKRSLQAHDHSDRGRGGDAASDHVRPGDTEPAGQHATVRAAEGDDGRVCVVFLLECCDERDVIRERLRGGATCGPTRVSFSAEARAGPRVWLVSLGQAALGAPARPTEVSRLATRLCCWASPATQSASPCISGKDWPS